MIVVALCSQGVAMGHPEGSSGYKSMILVTCAGALAVTALVAMVTLTPRSAEALPAYAQQTGKACGACHKSPAGGGALTSAGKAFQARGHK
jgi:mono/diheme cytochrome c family protein